MAEKKTWLGSQGPYLYDDADLIGDGDGDLSGEYYSGLATTGKVVATEFHGIPISSISVTDIDDPSTELNPLSASTVGGLIAVYQAVGAADDEFTMYLWDTNAAAENVPYTVDGNGGVWIAVSGKYQNTQLNVTGATFGGPTNYSEFESDGTLEFNGDATVWNDANVGGMTLGGPAATIPDEVKFTDENGVDTGIYSWGFAVGEKVTGSIELPHSYKEGSDIYFHVHWQGNDAPTGTDKVKWQLIYTVAQMGETLDAATTITKETDYDTQYEWMISAFAAITGTNFNMGDQFIFELSRVAASADEYGGDAVIGTVGIHYEQDTVGSRQITTK